MSGEARGDMRNSFRLEVVSAQPMNMGHVWHTVKSKHQSICCTGWAVASSMETCAAKVGAVWNPVMKDGCLHAVW